MVSNVFKLDGVAIKAPSDYEVSFQPITDSERTLDGTMIISGIAGKCTIKMTYTSITDDDLMSILGITWDEFLKSKKIKKKLTYPAPGGASATITVYFAPFSIRRTAQSNLRNKWENLMLEFVEI